MFSKAMAVFGICLHPLRAQSGQRVPGTLSKELESSAVNGVVRTGASSGLFPAPGIDGLATLVERLSRKGHGAVSGDR